MSAICDTEGCANPAEYMLCPECMDKLLLNKMNLALTNNNGWKVKAAVDTDGHLNIYVTNSDGSDIRDIDTGQGDGRHGEQYAMRFTTASIEGEYSK